MPPQASTISYVQPVAGSRDENRFRMSTFDQLISPLRVDNPFGKPLLTNVTCFRDLGTQGDRTVRIVHLHFRQELFKLQNLRKNIANINLTAVYRSKPKRTRKSLISTRCGRRPRTTSAGRASRTRGRCRATRTSGSSSDGADVI